VPGSFIDKTIELYVEGIQRAVEEGREHHAAVYRRNLARALCEARSDQTLMSNSTLAEEPASEESLYELSSHTAVT
jgi:hypothetical protein